MKVRIGYGLGVRTPTLDGARFAELVDALEALRFDSLWLSERVTGASPEPMVGLAYAAARTSRLKLGTSVQVLPGRNVHLLAKAWASLDRLSSGRCLPAFGLGVADPREQAAFGVAREERAKLTPPTMVIGHYRDPIHPFSDSDMLVRELPNARLVQASSILELRLTPERLTAEIVEFVGGCFKPAGRSGTRRRSTAGTSKGSRTRRPSA